MSRLAIHKQRDTVITFCEGEAELQLFAFLKSQYSNKKVTFKAINLKGVADLISFKRKYNKQMKSQGLKPKKDFANVRYLFIIDNDLIDSDKIIAFLKTSGHLVQELEPNAEGLMLGLAGQSQGNNLKTDVFRKKCKENFKNQFNCDAHQLKESKFKEIFNSETILKNKLPVLHSLFKA